MKNEIQKLIVEMYHEVEELKKKYGTRSKVAAKQSERVKKLARYFDNREAERVHYVAQYSTSQMLREKKEGKSYEDMAKLMGWNKKDWKLLDSVDKKLEAIKKQMDVT